MFDRSILLPALIAAGLAATTLPALAESGDHGLGRLIHERLREGGPFFTGPEQAVINRACGYAPPSPCSCRRVATGPWVCRRCSIGR